jgi:plasmid stabilization system protein ParE
MVKRKIIWSPKAKSDLLQILDFFFKRNGTKSYSKKLNSSIRKSVRLLERYSEIGINTDIHNVRNLIEGDYSIFYQIKSDTVEIISIWDNRQNPDNLQFAD